MRSQVVLRVAGGARRDQISPVGGVARGSVRGGDGPASSVERPARLNILWGSCPLARSVALLVVGICVVLLLGASTAAALPRVAAPQSGAAARIAWKGCGKGLQCARVLVPLDWSNPRRVGRLLARLRHGPIPAPSAPAPHRLSCGDLLLHMFANLGRPASWPQIAAGLEQAASGNGSTIETALQQTRPAYQSALNSATALQCADKPPPRLGPQAWPSIIGRLRRVSPFLAVTGWWLAVPCARGRC